MYDVNTSKKIERAITRRELFHSDDSNKGIDSLFVVSHVSNEGT